MSQVDSARSSPNITPNNQATSSLSHAAVTVTTATIAQPIIAATNQQNSSAHAHSISTVVPNADEAEQIELQRCLQTENYSAFSSHAPEALSKFFYRLTSLQLDAMYNGLNMSSPAGRCLRVALTINSIKSEGTAVNDQTIRYLKTWIYADFTSSDLREINALLQSSQHSFIKKIAAFFGTSSLPLTQANLPSFRKAIENAACADNLIRNRELEIVTYGNCKTLFQNEMTDTLWPVIQQILVTSHHPEVSKLRCFIQPEGSQEVTRQQFQNACSAWQNYSARDASFYFDIEQFEALLCFPISIDILGPILRAMQSRATDSEWIPCFLQNLQTTGQLSCDAIRTKLQEVKAFIKDCASLDEKRESELVSLLQEIPSTFAKMVGNNTSSRSRKKIIDKIKELYPRHPELMEVIRALPEAQKTFFTAEILSYAVKNKTLTSKEQLTQILALAQPPLDSAIASALQASANGELQRIFAWYAVFHEVVPAGPMKVLLPIAIEQSQNEAIQPPQKEIFQSFCNAVPGKESPLSAANIKAAIRGIKIWNDVCDKTRCSASDLLFLSSLQFPSLWKQKIDKGVHKLGLSQMNDADAILYLYKKTEGQRIGAIAELMQELPQTGVTERVRDMLSWVSLCSSIDRGTVAFEKIEEIFEQVPIDEQVVQRVLPNSSPNMARALSAMSRNDYISLRNQMLEIAPTNSVWKRAVQERVMQLRKTDDFAAVSVADVLQEAFSNRVIAARVQDSTEEQVVAESLLLLAGKNLSRKEIGEFVAAIKKRGSNDPVQQKFSTRWRQLVAQEGDTETAASKAFLQVIEFYRCQYSEHADLSTVRSLFRKNLSQEERTVLLQALFIDEPETSLKIKCKIRLGRLIENGTCENNAEGYQKAIDQLSTIYQAALSFDDIAILTQQNLTDEELTVLKETIQRKSPELVRHHLQGVLADGNADELYAAITTACTNIVTTLLHASRITLQDLSYIPTQTMNTEQTDALWTKLEEQNNATTPKDVEIEALITFGNSHGKQLQTAIEHAKNVVVTSLLAKETLTLQDVRRVLGRAITKAQADAVVAKIKTQLKTSAQPDVVLQAFMTFYEDLKKSWWDHLETKKASAAVLLPEALYIYNYLTRSETTQRVANTVLTKQKTLLPRMGVEHGAAMTIFARRKLSAVNPALAGSFKVPFASLTIQKTVEGIKIRPTIRMRATTSEFLQKNIDIVRDLGSPQEFGTFHAMVTYNNQSKVPEFSSIWDRATGDLEKVPTTAKQQLAIFKDVNVAILKLHDEDKIHADLKAKNMLCTINSSGQARGQLIDFDMTDKYKVINYYGTPGYDSPELVLHHSTNFPRAADMFAFGTAIYEVVFEEMAPWCESAQAGGTGTITRSSACNSMVLALNKYRTDNNAIIEKVESSTSKPLTEREILIYLSIRLLAIAPDARLTAAQLQQQFTDLSKRLVSA